MTDLLCGVAQCATILHLPADHRTIESASNSCACCKSAEVLVRHWPHSKSPVLWDDERSLRPSLQSRRFARSYVPFEQSDSLGCDLSNHCSRAFRRAFISDTALCLPLCLAVHDTDSGLPVNNQGRLTVSKALQRRDWALVTARLTRMRDSSNDLSDGAEWYCRCRSPCWSPSGPHPEHHRAPQQVPVSGLRECRQCSCVCVCFCHPCTCSGLPCAVFSEGPHTVRAAFRCGT